MADEHAEDADPWTARFYARGTQGFDRVIFFSDAVYAISLTLIAVQIVLPALSDLSTGGDAGQIIAEGLANIWAYVFTFVWIAFYWKANHRFTLTLRRMDNRYIWVNLAYLGFIALLPFPAAVIGEEWDPRALAFFFVYMACVSGMEVALMLVAIRDDLLVRELSVQQRRRWVLSASAPVVAALLSAPLCFVTDYGNVIAIVSMTVLSVTMSTLVARRYRVTL